jgi:hypothetical protein
MESTPNQVSKKTKRKDPVYRGLIVADNNTAYYIINELYSEEDNKLFSAAKMSTDNKSNNIEDSRYAVKYFSKKWIKEEVFTKFNIPQERAKKFFQALRKSFDSYRQIDDPNFQQLKDYIDKDDCIYVISEFCDYNLAEYIQILREPVRNSNFPFEVKVRNIIFQIMKTVWYLHENTSLSFGGLLNINDIQVVETGIDGISATTVKFPHPFLTNLQTILKIYKKSGFPSYFAPEVYNQFKESNFIKEIIKKDSFDLGGLFAKINQNFDMWALSYLIYEIVFDNPPFMFNSLEIALKELNDSFNYLIFPHQSSDLILRIIENGLKYKHQIRMNYETIKNYLDELKAENENLEEVEKKLRLKGIQKYDKAGTLFTIGDKNNIQSLQQDEQKV